MIKAHKKDACPQLTFEISSTSSILQYKNENFSAMNASEREGENIHSIFQNVKPFLPSEFATEKKIQKIKIKISFA